MRKLILLSVATLTLVVGVTVVLTARYSVDEPPVVAVPKVDLPDGAHERLASAIRIATVSSEDPDASSAASFARLHQHLQTSFPLVHTHLGREVVSERSLLYTWPGTDQRLRPMLLAGHMDVVPVEPATQAEWRYEPFAGQIAEGYIWGRGTIDNKSTVIGILEAVEMLLREGFRPARTVYLAYGHDEETGGTHGAQEIAALLRHRGVELEFVLDEGGVVGDGLLPGVEVPVALVGIAEKGFLTLELIARSTGGHSSLPPRQSAVGILSAALAKLDQHPMPERLDGATDRLFNRIGPRFPLVQRAVFANLWLTRRLVARQLQWTAATNAMVRTTAAPTMLQAGTRDNVLPGSARAVVNFRILPGDTVAGVLEHVRRVVDDGRVEIRRGGRFAAEPSLVSSDIASAAFRNLEASIRSVSPDVVVAPYLVVVVTDSRHYGDLARDIFRFMPLRLTRRDLDRIHGVDERIGFEEYETAIRTYRQILLYTTRGGEEA